MALYYRDRRAFSGHGHGTVKAFVYARHAVLFDVRIKAKLLGMRSVLVRCVNG